MSTSITETPTAELNVDEIVEHAKRAFALKQFETAVDRYATALEIKTKQFGEDAPEIADLYFSYGKALLENAISQTSILGKDQVGDELEGDNELGPKDEGNMAEDTEGEDEDVDGTNDAEPEDDFNAAWDVLELARGIYDHLVNEDGDEEVKLKLADTYVTLGDVSLETEKFDQAIADYSAGLALKSHLIPISSRQIAEAHYKLSMVLDLTSGRLADAITHVEKALESVELRMAELRDHPNEHVNTRMMERVKTNIKSEGKYSGGRLVRDISVHEMSESQIESELKDLEGLKEDLALKVEELKTSPRDHAVSAPSLAAQALDEELNRSILPSDSNDRITNDLTSMVVRKKKGPEKNETIKRKAGHDIGGANLDKKAKLES